MTIRFRSISSTHIVMAAIVGMAGLGSMGAHGAGQRSFVASTGDDLAACSLSAPCRSFARAITQTDPDGEVIVLDSAGYGPVVVNKSVAIIAPAGVYAGVTVFNGDGIVINGGSISVVLRGLAINGQGGDRGIFYTLGSRLRVENCIVSNMRFEGIRIGYGGKVVIADTVLRDNETGIHIAYDADVVVERARIEGNSAWGIYLGGPLSSALAVRDSLVADNGDGIGLVRGATVTLTGSTLTRNSWGVFAQVGSGSIRLFAERNVITAGLSSGFRLQELGGTIAATLTDNLISGNSYGIHLSPGANNTVILDRNTITGNGTGVDQGGGVIYTRSNNTVRLNGTNVVNGPLTAVGGT